MDGSVVGEGSIIAAGAVVTRGTQIPPHSLVVGCPAKVVKNLGEKSGEQMYNQAIKYENLWTQLYGLLPDGGGVRYHGEKIV